MRTEVIQVDVGRLPTMARNRLQWQRDFRVSLAYAPGGPEAAAMAAVEVRGTARSIAAFRQHIAA